MHRNEKKKKAGSINLILKCVVTVQCTVYTVSGSEQRTRKGLTAAVVVQVMIVISTKTATGIQQQRECGIVVVGGISRRPRPMLVKPQVQQEKAREFWEGETSHSYSDCL